MRRRGLLAPFDHPLPTAFENDSAESFDLFDERVDLGLLLDDYGIQLIGRVRRMHGVVLENLRTLLDRFREFPGRGIYVIAHVSRATVDYERSIGFTHSHNDEIQWTTHLEAVDA